MVEIYLGFVFQCRLNQFFLVLAAEKKQKNLNREDENYHHGDHMNILCKHLWNKHDHLHDNNKCINIKTNEYIHEYIHIYISHAIAIAHAIAIDKNIDKKLY